MNVYRLLVGAAVTFVVFAGLLAVPASAQGFKWWHDETFRRELGLTAEQRGRLEGIFQESLPHLRRHKDALDRSQAEFDRLVEQGTDDSVIAQVNDVEAARAALNKARALMLLRMRRTLTTDQWVKFTALQQQHDAGRQYRQPPR